MRVDICTNLWNAIVVKKLYIRISGIEYIKETVL